MKVQQKESRYEYVVLAEQIEKEIFDWLGYDLGAKRVNRDLTTFIHHAKIGGEDRITFQQLCDKYQIGVESDIPLWKFEVYQEWLVNACRSLINNIAMADAIKPRDLQIYYLHKKYQHEAIGNCFQIEQAIKSAKRNIPKVQLGKYNYLLSKLARLIELLKRWRRDEHVRNAIERETLKRNEKLMSEIRKEVRQEILNEMRR